MSLPDLSAQLRALTGHHPPAGDTDSHRTTATDRTAHDAATRTSADDDEASQDKAPGAGAAERPAPDLPALLDELLRSAVQAVPSCLAVSITLICPLPLTLTALTLAAGLEPARSSLQLRLPGPPSGSGGAQLPGGSGGVLTVWAAQPGALRRLTSGLLALLGVHSRSAVIDSHLQLPALAGAPDVLASELDDLSALNQALGVLLDRGLLPDQSLAELESRAQQAASSVPAAARQLLTDMQPPDPTGRPVPAPGPDEPA